MQWAKCRFVLHEYNLILYVYSMSSEISTRKRVLAEIEKRHRRAVAFRVVYAKVAGGTVAGLLLSQIVYWSQRTTDPDGWFYKSQEEWCDELSLSRRLLETARRKL